MLEYLQAFNQGLINVLPFTAPPNVLIGGPVEFAWIPAKCMRE
jgi:hypothetical protein